MKRIKALNVAVLCPTKDNPEKVRRLLKCLAALTEKPGQIIIADGGHNLKPMVKEFAGSMNLKCLYCPQPGQILQRSYAQQHLNKAITVVVHLDDDITFAPNFMSRLVETWNRLIQLDGSPLAGFSFNLMDMPSLHNSFIRQMFFLSTQPPGSVSKAGYAAPFCPADQDREVSWLLGGATVWSRSVLEEHQHPLSFPTRWAVCEDLLYSYPLHMDYRMLVVTDVECFHNETYSNMSFRQGIFYGVSSAIMRYHFIRQHAEMKTWAWLWMTIGVVLGNLAKGMLGSPRHLGLFAGGVEGMTRACICSLMSGDSEDLAKQLGARKS